MACSKENLQLASIFNSKHMLSEVRAYLMSFFLICNLKKAEAFGALSFGKEGAAHSTKDSNDYILRYVQPVLSQVRTCCVSCLLICDYFKQMLNEALIGVFGMKRAGLRVRDMPILRLEKGLHLCSISRARIDLNLSRRYLR